MQRFKFETPFNVSDLIDPNQFRRLPGCGSRFTMYGWMHRGLWNRSRSERVRLPSFKWRGTTVTTIEAHDWWTSQLQR